MDETLRKTWDEVAHRWNDYASPLRPHADDLAITLRILRRWHAHHSVERARVFLCGVTPEIATMDWPFPIEMIAMDQAASMVRSVWPGDVPGLRTARIGNWMDSGLAAGSRDIVIGDGGFGFFSYPDKQRALLDELHRMLAPGGIFVYRHYAQAPRRESVEQVLTDARAGRIGNFHIFKWRLAMAMQPDSAAGVMQDDIWHAVVEAHLHVEDLPQPGWSAAAYDTIHFYRGKSSRLYFPTLEEFRSLLASRFDRIEVEFPSYELGDRCPIFAAQ